MGFSIWWVHLGKGPHFVELLFVETERWVKYLCEILSNFVNSSTFLRKQRLFVPPVQITPCPSTHVPLFLGRFCRWLRDLVV